mgnify:FL=1
MYTYNKDDKSYTFSFDDINLDNLINTDLEPKDENNTKPENNTNETEENNTESPAPRPQKIEVINGGNDLDISPVSDYIEVEKPKSEKKDNIVIPENQE